MSLLPPPPVPIDVTAIESRLAGAGSDRDRGSRTSSRRSIGLRAIEIGPDALDELAQRQVRAPLIQPPSEPLRVVDAASLYGKAVPQRQHLCAPLIPARNVTLLAGDGGTGKSLLALQLVFLYVPALNELFGVAPIGVREWVLTSVLAFVVFLVVEAIKALDRRRERPQTLRVGQR